MTSSTPVGISIHIKEKDRFRRKIGLSEAVKKGTSQLMGIIKNKNKKIGYRKPFYPTNSKQSNISGVF